MKRVLLALLLSVSVVANAQDWITQQSMIVSNPNGQDVDWLQKAECLNDKYIIALSAKHKDSCYFTSWYREGMSFTQSQVFSCVTIYDFAILEDRVYFCGKRNTPTDSTGFIGVFQVNDLINGNPITYGVRDISGTRTLKRLEVYKYGNATHIVAIGELDVSLASNKNGACFVAMDDKLSPGFHYRVLSGSTSFYPTFERMKDIVVTDMYVATVSSSYYSSGFFVRRFDLDTPEDPTLQMSYEYTFPNYQYFALALSGRISMCKITKNYVVIGTSAGELVPYNERHFVFLNYIDLYNMGIMRNNEIPRLNKLNEIFKMVYSVDTRRLLLLENWDLFNVERLNQSITHIYPNATTSYQTRTDYINPDYFVNDIDITRPTRYFTTGVNPYSNSSQFIHTKEIRDSISTCDKYKYFKVDCTQNGIKSQMQNISASTTLSTAWNMTTIQVNTYQWNLDCIY